jgi:hypothetical protein
MEISKTLQSNAIQVAECSKSKGVLRYEHDADEIAERIKHGEILTPKRILDELRVAITRNLPDMTKDEARAFQARAMDVHEVVSEELIDRGRTLLRNDPRHHYYARNSSKIRQRAEACGADETHPTERIR